jgi:hypothetical protein
MRLFPIEDNRAKTSPCQPVWIGEGFYFCAIGRKCPEYRSFYGRKSVTGKVDSGKPELSMGGAGYSPAPKLGVPGIPPGIVKDRAVTVRGVCGRWRQVL